MKTDPSFLSFSFGMLPGLRFQAGEGFPFSPVSER
jgi:hypothetical protein